ncbi:MAG: helix-turn-helix domain-containing protein, partial [Pelobium sp.]
VMFVKNDASRDKLYYNGKIGKIVKIKGDEILVKCPGDFQAIAVNKALWENFKFELNPDTKEIEEQVLGTFSQHPLKLAWAITIHKSQGLTFEKAIIDANAAFAHGQVYVALSRCKTFEGMVLSSKISFNSVKTDGTVSTYTKNAAENAPDEAHLNQSKSSFQQNLLYELFDFNPLKGALFQLKKLAEDYHPMISNGFLENINQVRELFELKCYSVAEKFKKHLHVLLQQNGLPQENDELQERVKKGCQYFTEALVEQEQELAKVDFDADNKAIKKLINDAQENLKKELFIKHLVMNLGKNGFETLAYLKVKANAEIDFNNLKKTETPDKVVKAPTGVQHADLYQILKKWRDDLASENGTPVYQVLPQKVLVDLVAKLPSNFEELESIKGIGKVKVKQYGNELLIMIADFCEQKEIPQAPLQGLTSSKKEKVDTKKVSLDLFKEGKSVEEIATIRDFTVGTIETHLTHFITTQEISIFDFMDKIKVDKIIEYILENKPASMNDTKAAMGNEISYGEIRAVMKHLENLNN